MSAPGWYSTMILLQLPSPALLVGPYSASTLSPNSFSSTSELAARLRCADVVLYNLLIAITSNAWSELPAWPPAALTDLKVMRAELSKGVEKVVRTEKNSWQEQVIWRRSWLDEAKGKGWERCLDCLATVALRRAVEGRDLAVQLRDLGALSSLSTAEALSESLSRIPGLYSAETDNVNGLLMDRRVELAHLRRERDELLSTRAVLAAGGGAAKENDSLDLAQLLELRGQRAAQMEKGVWELLMTGDPKSKLSDGAPRMDSAPKQRPTLRPPPVANLTQPTSSSSVTSHLRLISSLATLCDPPALPSPISASTSAEARSAHPSHYSTAFELDTLRLSTLPSPAPATPPPPPISFTVDASSPSSSSLAHLLRPSRPVDEGLELKVARVLDSLEVKPVRGRPKEGIKSRLPLARSAMGSG